MKKYGIPFILIIAGSFILYLIRTYISFAGKDTLLAVLTAVMAFIFGATLNSSHSSRGDTWIKKMIVMFLFIFFLLIYMGVVRINLITQALNFIGFNSTMYFFLFVWFGFLFFC